MKGSALVVAAVLAATFTALGAGPARAQSEYLSECVAAAVRRAEAEGSYRGYGLVKDSFCLLGGWITQGHMLQYTMTLKAGRRYLFVGAADRDVEDLDLSVTDGPNVVSDAGQGNTPLVHVEAESTVEVTIALTNAKGSGQPDFCGLIILEDQGGQANLAALGQAAAGLCQAINARGSDWETDKASDGSSWCLMGGLMSAGEELSLSRSFGAGPYLLVGWGDARAGDVDALVLDEAGEVLAADTATDNRPEARFDPPAPLRATLVLRMHQAKGDAFAVCAVLRRK
ncbi:MAG: hypothetical protein M9894_04220 [Planctomycetes bacterium]|nr:hypothetical protein [Planctomycetota bacterium]